MSREMTIIVLGIWVLIIPHLGIPGSWRGIVLTCTGLLIIAVGLYLRAIVLSRGVKRTKEHPFVENMHERESHASHDSRQEIHSTN